MEGSEEQKIPEIDQSGNNELLSVEGETEKTATTVTKKPDRDGNNRMLCGMCNEYIPSSSSVNHIWQKHLDLKPWVCPICNKEFQYAMGFGAKKHILNVHHDSETTITDNRALYKNVYREMRHKCFPVLSKGDFSAPSTPVAKSATATATLVEGDHIEETDLANVQDMQETSMEVSDVRSISPVIDTSETYPQKHFLTSSGKIIDVSEMYTCQKCDHKVMSSHRSNHSWIHFGVKPLKCSLCDRTYGYNAMTQALKHLESDHIGMNGEIVDERPQYRDAYVALHQECFPREKKEKKSKTSSPSKSQSTETSFPQRKENETNLFAVFNFTEGSQAKDSTVNTMTKGEPDKVKCSLCRVEVLNGYQLYSHVWSHMKIKQFGCSLCDFVCEEETDSSFAVRRHLVFNHQSQGTVVDRRPLFTSEYESMFSTCFSDIPVYHPTTNKTTSFVPKPAILQKRPQVLKAETRIPVKRNVTHIMMKPDYKRKFQQKRVVVHDEGKKIVRKVRVNSLTNSRYAVSECRLCHIHVVTKAHHVWGHHMSQRPFSCSKCNQGFGLHDRGVLHRHISRIHKGQGKVIDHREELGTKVQEFLEKCFPPGSLVSDGLPAGGPSGVKINRPVGRPPGIRRVRSPVEVDVGDEEIEDEESVLKAVEPFVMIEDEGLINDSEQEALEQLTYLIAPVLPDSFLEKVWQKNVIIVRRKCSNYYDNLFTKSLFQKVIETHHLQWGKDVTMLRYFDSKQDCLNHGETAVHPTRVWDLYRDNSYSILLHHPQRFSAHVWKVCDGLQELFCTDIIGTVYMTPINSSTCPPHWQDMDEFIIQTNGRKHWSLYKPKDQTQMFPAGTTSESSLIDGDVIFDDWVEQGDLLYIPRGFISFAKTTDQPSVHVTVRIPNKNNSYGAMLKKLLPKMMCLCPELRESFPVQYFSYAGTSAEQHSNRVQDRVAFKEKLKEFMGKLSDRVLEFADSGVDLMAMEFMKNAIPPALTSTERASSSTSDAISTNFTLESRVKLLRKHGQTLIYRPRETVLVHRMKNERDCNQTNHSEIIIEEEAVPSVELLIKNYPNFTSIKELPTETDGIKLDLIGNLSRNNIILIEQ